MKKFLSLVLALVMTFSLMTVAASAKTADLTDGSKIAYPEAVDVITTLKVMDGYTDGSFGPTNILTREQAAKIICVLAVGRDTADKLGTSTAPFKDVAADRWSAGYIAYCANAGIIDGYADGTFKPANTLTGYQFLKMLLGVVGYKSGVEGFTGTNWTVAVAKLAIQAGMVDGNSSFVGSQGVTREEAALYAFNTLQADEVYYEQTGTSITVGGTTIVTGTSAAKKVEGSKDTIVDDSYMQFAEEHFPELKLSSPTNAKGEPSNKWVYKNVAIGTYAKTADIVFTAETSEKNIKAALDGIDCTNPKEVTWNGYTYTVDFSAIDSVAKLAAYMDEESVTADGRIVEIFNTSSKLYVVVLDTVVAQITKINTTDDEVTLKVFYDGDVITGIVVEEDDTGYDLLSGMKKDDYVLVMPDINTNSPSDYEDVDGLLEAYKGTAVSGKYTKYADATHTVGGNKYDESACFYDTGDLDLGNTGTILLDQFGYMIAMGVDTADTTYAYLLNTDRSGSAKTGYTYSAQLLYTDGKTEWVDVTEIEGDDIEKATSASFFLNMAEGFVSYDKLADGTYNIAEEENVKTDGTITKGTIAMFEDNTQDDSGVTPKADPDCVFNANSATVFLMETSTTGKFDVYTGIKNVPTTSSDEAYVLEDGTSGIAKIVVIRSGNLNTSANDQVFFYNNTVIGEGTIKSVDVNYYKVVVNGEKTTVAVKATEEPSVGLYFKNTYITSGDESYVSKLGDLVDGDENDNSKTVLYARGATNNLTLEVSKGVLTLTQTGLAGTPVKYVIGDDFAVTVVAGATKDDVTVDYDLGADEDAITLTGSSDYAVVVKDGDGYAIALYVYDV